MFVNLRVACNKKYFFLSLQAEKNSRDGRKAETRGRREAAENTVTGLFCHSISMFCLTLQDEDGGSKLLM